MIKYFDGGEDVLQPGEEKDLAVNQTLDEYLLKSAKVERISYSGRKGILGIISFQVKNPLQRCEEM